MSGDRFNAFLARPDEPGEGIPLGVKDLFDTAGLTTTYGSAIFGDHVPSETAEAVRLLADAGYAVVGKTNLHEFAYGITSENPHYGDVVNPLDPGRIPGGSSGGSAAALAAGLCDAALGTDSAGSIRLPAACCGIAGFKPTFGLVSAHGAFPLAPTFDHAGPMARDVAGCAAMMEALAPSFEPLGLDGLGDLRAALAWTEHASVLVRERVEAAARLFPSARQVDFPHPVGFGTAFMHEVAEVHRDLFAQHADRYGPTVRTKVERALAITDEEAARARDERERYRAAALEAFGDADLLFTPTMLFVAPPVGIGDLALREEVIRLTRPFNSLGWPALALPCGPAEHGLPASLQVVGRPGADALVLAAGAAIEAVLPPRP